MKLSILLGALATICSGYAVKKTSWPNGPFTAKGTDMVDASGNRVIYAGVNWPGAAEVMFPDGLQYNSIENIVSIIKDKLGMNVVRLTYAIEMLDEALEGGSQNTIQNALVSALGAQNGTRVLNQVLQNNPSFTAQTTRLEVYDAIAAELNKKQVYLHLDNHVSKAEWCCSHTDGNAWFGAGYFNVTKWKRGLAYMANHGKNWPALTSMSLRNELREPDPPGDVPYGWPGWYDNMIPAAQGIYEANTFPLIFFSGLNYDTTLQPVTNGSDLGGGRFWRPSDYVFKDKIVYELHNYDNSATNCSSMQESLYTGGFNAMDTSSSSTAVNHGPVVLTEFGFLQANKTYENVYAQCIKTSILGFKAGFMQWVLAGSYYIRQDGQDVDESWGLLDHTWNDWRSEDAVNDYTRPFVEAVLSNKWSNWSH